MDFNNKVVIVTGASAGIGASAAILFANHSANVVLVGRNVEALNDIARKCEESKGIKPLIVKAELTSDDDIKSIVAKTIEEYGRIDVLINNAGMGLATDITDGMDNYDKIMNTNIRSTYYLTSLAVPHLIKSKGNIINVSSIASMKPFCDIKFLPYGMSKAAMDHFTKYLALELGPLGVRVNSVNPGATKTGFVITARLDNPEHIASIRNATIPLRKMAEAEDVADLIVYVASDRGRSITGSILVIDNGEILA